MYYDIVILGATSAALGLANELKQKYKTLIINRTSMVAYEFVNAYKRGENWNVEPETEFGRAIREELLREKIITKEEAHIYSAGPIFYKAFKDLGIDILLETELISVKKEYEGYIISVYNVGGHDTIKARYIIDTTEREADIKSKSLNCLLTNKKKDVLPPIKLDGVEIYKEVDNKINTAILKYNCPLDTSLYEARHQVIETWRNRPQELADWKIAAIGLCFDVVPRVGFKQIGKFHVALPSAYYDNPLAAIDAGVNLGRRIGDDL